MNNIKYCKHNISLYVFFFYILPHESICDDRVLSYIKYSTTHTHLGHRESALNAPHRRSCWLGRRNYQLSLLHTFRDSGCQAIALGWPRIAWVRKYRGQQWMGPWHYYYLTVLCRNLASSMAALYIQYMWQLRSKRIRRVFGFCSKCRATFAVIVPPSTSGSVNSCRPRYCMSSLPLCPQGQQIH